MLLCDFGGGGGGGGGLYGMSRTSLEHSSIQ